MFFAGIEMPKPHEGLFNVVSSSVEETAKDPETTFAQLFAHFQQSGELVPNLNKSSRTLDIPEKRMPHFLDAVLSLLPEKTRLTDKDRELVIRIMEEMDLALDSEQDDSQILIILETLEMITKEEISIDMIMTEVRAHIESLVFNPKEAVDHETLEMMISELAVIIAFAFERGEDVEPMRRQVTRDIHQWLSAMKDDVQPRSFARLQSEPAERNMRTRAQPSQLNSLLSITNATPILTRASSGKFHSPTFVFNESLATQPLNHGEQLMIHIGEQKTTHARAVAFIKEFQHALGKGHLRADGEGRQALTIKLYPENLGRLDVQITRGNGVLQAKLVTTTTAARELVESQLPQLRHAFHHQQLPVERVIVETSDAQMPEKGEREPSGEEEPPSDHEGEHDDDEAMEGLPSFEEWLQLAINQDV